MGADGRSLEGLNRHTEFWYSDGSIILAVEDTAFRVHQSILAKHSDVFADMFTLPLPADGVEKLDGCPVVRLTDSLSDFIDVMKALFQPL